MANKEKTVGRAARPCDPLCSHGKPVKGGFEFQGLIASNYDVLYPEMFDVDFFRKSIEQRGEPALEIGCGTGRLLLEYVRSGLDVDGVDASADMLAICRRKAADLGLRVRLQLQRMEELEMGRRYNTLYIPAATLMSVIELADVRRALRRFHAHLNHQGQLIVPFWVPKSPKHEIKWRLCRKAKLPPSDSVVQLWSRSRYDYAEQLLFSDLRCEIIRSGRLEKVQEGCATLRWHTQDQFESLLGAAGFRIVKVVRNHTWDKAEEGDRYFTFLATKT